MFDWLFGRKKQVRLTTQYPDTDATPSPSVNVEHLASQVEGLGQQIARLMDQAGVLQEQLDRLDYRTAFGNDQLETLTGHLSDVADWAGPLDRRLAELATWAEESREALTQLEEGIRKLSRTQFKTNSLAEAQQERLQSALATLQELATRKQEDAEKARQQQREAAEAARGQARVAMATDLFPALDGLESALQSGRAFLDQDQQPTAGPGFLSRLAYAFGLRDLPTTTGDMQALAAWLDGLELVRERFLALLWAEGVQPIRAEGQPFDPHHHVAVETVQRPDLPPGIVVEELRSGYRLGDRVLRYAEVVVSRNEVETRYWAGEPEEQPMAVPETHHRDSEPIVTWGTADLEAAAEETDEIEGVERPEIVPGDLTALSGLSGLEPVLGETEGPARSETEGADEDLTGFPKPVRSAGGAGDDAHKLDPEIQEMIARFEARQRDHRITR